MASLDGAGSDALAEDASVAYARLKSCGVGTAAQKRSIACLAQSRAVYSRRNCLARREDVRSAAIVSVFETWKRGQVCDVFDLV